MPSPTPGHDPRLFSATQTPEPLSDGEVALAHSASPPPLPLIRRKATATAALGLPAPTGSAAPDTAPWPSPAVPGDAKFAGPAAPEAEPDFSPSAHRWWKRLKSPSRPVWIGALIAVVAGGIGWTAGAKPWASPRMAPTARAAKHSPTQRSTAPVTIRARASQAATHVNRRVAIKAKNPVVPSMGVQAPTAKAPSPAIKAPVAATKAAKAPVAATKAAKAPVAATKAAKAPVAATKAAKAPVAATKAAKAPVAATKAAKASAAASKAPAATKTAKAGGDK